MHTRPLAEGVFTPAPDPHLVGGRHLDTGHVVFPCPQGAQAALFERVALPREGTLWSWTVQRFRPKSPPYAGPALFEPFALGYVALAGHVIVETRLTGIAFDDLRIGMKLRLTTIAFSTDDDGTVVSTYAFEPAVEQAA